MNRNDVKTFEGTENALWGYGEGFIKAYTEDAVTRNRLEKIEGAILCNSYSLPAWDFVIPASCREQVEKTLELV
jgi:hypothetical protein